ncbi:MAG: hypothetical protein ACXADA_14245 [Candidatus Hodarchaeales archaeon]|jgi:hypothetical protein
MYPFKINCHFSAISSSLRGKNIPNVLYASIMSDFTSIWEKKGTENNDQVFADMIAELIFENT